jgi:hypothetical protein
VVLAHLLVEDRQPSDALWDEELASSRLLEYEIWVRIHARRLATSHAEEARRLLERIGLLEMTPLVLARALDPFPAPVRTLDALHLASIEYLRSRGQRVELASYDDRMLLVARALGIPLREM